MIILAIRALTAFLFSWSASADIADRLQGATASLISTTPLVNGQLPDEAKFWAGTAFLARYHGEVFWFTAAHVTRGVRSNRRRLLLVEDPKEAFEYIAVGRLEGQRLIESRLNSELGRVDRNEVGEDKAADVAWFPANGRNYESRALELRDLTREPLQINETLYLSGVDGTEVQQRRTVRCAYKNPWGGYQILIQCPDIKVAGGLVWAGSFSGGIVADRQGRAVAIFSGYLPLTPVNLRAALLPR